MSKYLPIYSKLNTTKCKMIGIADYSKYWQNVADNSLWDQTWQIHTQHQTGKYARGFYYFYYGISTLIPFVIILCSYEIYTRNKRYKIRQDKISFKNDTICIISHYHRSDVSPYEACNLCIQIRWVTHTPWKLTETYSGCHTTQPIQHITLCCQGPWPT